MPEALKERPGAGSTPISRCDVAASSSDIGRTIEIVGALKSSQDFIFAGKLEGSLECQGNVIVLDTGHISGNIIAESLSLQGEVVGDIDVVDIIEIRSDAKLVGDVRCTRIMIEDGAYFKGSIDISKQQKRVGLAVVGSPEASRLDDVAENEIALGAYEDLNDYALFRRGRAVANAAPAVAQELKFNAGRR